MLSQVDSLVAKAVRTRNVHIFIDESGIELDRYDREHIRLAVCGRHYGHNLTFISQRYTMLSPSIREGADWIWIFGSPLEDQAEIFSSMGLRAEPVELDRFEGLLVQSWGKDRIRRFRIDPAKNQLLWCGIEDNMNERKKE